MDFKEISGIVAVLAVTLYGIYVLFFAKRQRSILVTAGRHNFEPGDTVTIQGQTYRVVDVNSQTSVTVEKA